MVRHRVSTLELAQAPALSFPPQGGRVDTEKLGRLSEGGGLSQDSLDVRSLDIIERREGCDRVLPSVLGSRAPAMGSSCWGHFDLSSLQRASIPMSLALSRFVTRVVVVGSQSCATEHCAKQCECRPHPRWKRSPT